MHTLLPFMKKILDEKKGKFFKVFLDSQCKISPALEADFDHVYTGK